MKMALKFLILMVALTAVERNVTARRLDERRRWKNGRNHAPHVNVCDIQERESKVHCYCESIQLQTATKADCWVFNGGIAADDPFWSNFYSQPKIKKLTFNIRADGGLTYIPAKVVVRLEHLQYLNIHFANIFCIQSFAFTNSTTLREIILVKNKIASLEKMAFAHLIMLSNVSLMENQISEIDADVFYMLPNLQRLCLSKNMLTTLHDGCFKHLTNLKRLDLDNNQLSVIIRENFQGLSNLITLDVRKNKLSMIGDLALAELWNLQELYLDGNEVAFISERAFRRLSQLRKLSLADNRLSALDVAVFNNLLSLNSLNLRNNKLETMLQETFQNLQENMKTSVASFSLEGNKLSCDCRLSWLFKLRNETNSKRIAASLDRLDCFPDRSLQARLESVAGAPGHLDRKQLDGDHDLSYDDPTLTQHTDFVLNLEYRRKLLEIPEEMLPCPEMYTDELPNRNEVKYFTKSPSHVLKPLSWLTLIAAMCNLTQ